jgi:very-short-patch-repair endonuclease
MRVRSAMSSTSTISILQNGQSVTQSCFFGLVTTMNSLIALVVLVAIVAILITVLQRLTFAAKQSFPFAKREYFFSAAERSFYEVLRRLTPDHTLFAKVRLADLVRVTTKGSDWRSQQNRIDRKHVDFVLCNADLAPVLAIELDDSSHSEQRRRDRDAFVDQVLVAAAIPIVRVPARRGYQLDELRQLLSPHLKPRP